MNATILFFIIIILELLVLGGIIVFLVIAHHKEKEEIFNRYMAGDYKTYQYYDKEYEKFVDRKDESIKEKIDREKNMTSGERKRKEAASQF